MLYRTAFVFCCCAVAAGAQNPVELVSVDSAGAQANAVSKAAALSHDGRYVAILSDASNLVLGDTNGVSDVFIRDRVQGLTRRVSVSSSGVQANSPSAAAGACLSADGQRVVFLSWASNLVANDTNETQDAFLHDLSTGQTRRVSVDSAGLEANDSSSVVGLSANGQFVVFTSQADNLVAGDTNAQDDVFVLDLTTNQTTRVSVDSNGLQAHGGSFGASLSADGRWAAFTSVAPDLVASDTNGFPDGFLHDRLTGQTLRLGHTPTGAQSVGWTLFAQVCADGTHAAFASTAGDLVPADTNARADVFVYEIAGGAIERVSVDSAGAQANEQSLLKGISADGKRLVFSSIATNLVAQDTNGVADVFVHERTFGRTVRVSANASGVQGNAASFEGWISGDGLVAGFFSDATNLVPGDLNAARDAFVTLLPPDCAADSYCTSGVSSNGCIPLFTGVGLASASATSGFTLLCTQVDGQREGVVFYGTGGQQALPWAPGNSSFLCVKTPVQRTGIQPSGGTIGACDGAFAIDFLQFIATHPGALGAPLVAGQSVWAQTWYRDPPAPKSTQLSNGVRFAMCP